MRIGISSGGGTIAGGKTSLMTGLKKTLSKHGSSGITVDARRSEDVGVRSPHPKVARTQA